MQYIEHIGEKFITQENPVRIGVPVYIQKTEGVNIFSIESPLTKSAFDQDSQQLCTCI